MLPKYQSMLREGQQVKQESAGHQALVEEPGRPAPADMEAVYSAALPHKTALQVRTELRVPEALAAMADRRDSRVPLAR